MIRTVTRASLIALLAAAPAAAGTPAPSAVSAPNHGDWCAWLKENPGTLHKDADNPWLQEFLIEGRYQYQIAYLDGTDINGNDFHSTFDEHRRFRLGTRAKFLNYFGLKTILNLVNDERRGPGGLDWGYHDFDEAMLTFDVGKAFGTGPFDSLVVNFGRGKFLLSHEARASSTRLFTLERSAISNKVYASARPTGFSVDAKSGAWQFSAAIYSAGRVGGDTGFLSGWHGDQIYWGSVGYDVSDQLKLRFDAVYNESTFGADSVLPYRWATSLNADYDAGRWGIIGDMILGDNGGAGQGNVASSRRGGFHGLVIMPHVWLAGDWLQGVFQYQYGGSSAANGVRVNSRYGRAGDNAPAQLNSGRGDSHHSFYLGLNHYLCGHNAKIQAGVEYQVMNTPVGSRGKFDTTTYQLGLRTFF